jgi:hypothetical protein
MENTLNLSLPYIMPSQAQKHVTHNEALRILDAIVQLAIIDRGLADPPPSPTEGDRYIVAAGATGAWEGKDNRIAAWQDDGWNFLDPKPGWLAFVLDEAALFSWTGSAWQAVTGPVSELQNLALLGLGTTADGANPFAAKLNNALWAALSTGEGGNGDLRYIMNKQGTANVLSLLMQSNWSGRAEIGLVGNDDLSFKVSTNGSDWTEALKIDRQSGKVSFPRTNLLSDFAVNMFPDSGRFAVDQGESYVAGSFVFPSYLALYGGATASDGGKFITDNNDYGGTAGTLSANIKDLVDLIRDPAYRRYGVEFRVAEITMGADTSTPISIAGVPYYLGLLMNFRPRTPRMTFHIYMRALDGTIAYRCYPGQTIIKNGVASTTHVTISPAEGWVSVTVRDEQDPYLSGGYNPTPLNVHGAAVGHRFLLACPALMGGITSVDDNVGVIASARVQDILFPQITTTQRDAISSPAAGLVIYNTTTKAHEVYWDTAWRQLVATNATQTLTGKTIDAGSNTISGLPAAIEFVIDGGDATITTGIKGDLEIPFGCTIQAITLIGDRTGSIVVDIWKDTYANFPPTDADSITASAPPTISSAVKGQDSTLTGWTKTINAGDILRFNVDSVTSIQRATLSLKVVKT